MPEQYADLNNDYADCEPSTIEKITREQSDSTKWFDERKNHLTASNFGRVLNRKSAPNEKFLGSLFSARQISAPSLDYGKRHEDDAKSKYLEMYSSRHIHKCGLIVNKEFAFLGASPDGKVCDNGQCGLVEIKCPFTARSMTISDACDTLRDFFLSKDNNVITLKKSHAYYAQVQGQLMISGYPFCDFIVYTQKDSFVERIQPDLVFMSTMIENLSHFFKTYAKPFLTKQNVQN